MLLLVLSFVEIGTSPWKSTLTELYLGYFIENEDFQYIAELHNLKVFSLAICLYAVDSEIAPLKVNKRFFKTWINSSSPYKSSDD